MIRSEIDGDGVAILTWDLPGRSQNVLHDESMAAFAAAMEAALADPGVSGIIVTSGKEVFLAGADLAWIQRLAFGGAESKKNAGALGAVLRRLETGGKPVVAALNGTALGGGFELALACHRRIAADHPKLRVGLPEVTLGLLPGAGGTQRLPRLIGINAALPLLLEGRPLKAREALAAGLVDEVVPPGELLAAARAWLASKPAATQPWDRKGFVVPGGDPEAPAVRQTFSVANAMVLSKTQGRMPAPRAILSCVYEGLRTTIDAGLLIEQRYFSSLLIDPVAGNLIRTTFFGVQEANKLRRRPDDVPKLRPQRIGVLGAGLMGSGIAYVAARAGLGVVVIDTDEERARTAVRYAEARLAPEVKKGRLTAEGAAAVTARIVPTVDYARLAGCDVVIEAVFEDRAVKAEVTAQADAVLPEGAVLASNTSTLPITGLAAASGRPESFVGLHFFSPVEKMPLVEVIPGRQTSEATLAHALDLVQAIGKTPIVVKDSRGFYTSRVFATYVMEGLAMVAEGVPPARIEAAGRQAGMPMPPLALADDVGLSLMRQIRRQTATDLGDAYVRHPGEAVLERLVDAGRRGRRDGGGFYEGEGEARALWSGLASLWPSSGEAPTVDALVERLLGIQAVEAARCMAEGLLQAPIDADVGAVLGWGMAPWTGGPCSYIDTIGAATFVERADALADAHGERFRPPAALREMAARDGRYYPAG